MKKVNWQRVAVTFVGVFLLAFVASAAKLPSLIGAGDFEAARDLAYSGALAAVGAVVEALFHKVTGGFGDPTTP